MVEDRLRDGVRIAQLLASEITGGEGRLGALHVTDADPDVEPAPDGAFAYRVVHEDAATGRETAVAEVLVRPERARVEFVTAPETVADAARREGLRVDTPAGRTRVLVESGAQVKQILPVFAAVAEQVRSAV